MSLHRRNPKRDANEKPIVAALRAVGVRVWLISGTDQPDILTLWEGRWLPLGVKMPNGALTKGEAAGVPWPLVRTIDEAFGWVGVTRGSR